MDKTTRVVVGMSGGVDSSVAAGLLVQAGYQVTGIMLRLWSEEGVQAGNRCCTPDAMGLARRVAQKLGIPFYVVNAKEAFRNQVVEQFIQGYRAGVTPNPCLTCNRQIRWQYLYEWADALGAQYLATGHYARIRHEANGFTRLLKGQDADKDQSYALSYLRQEQLAHTLFPVGEYTKAEVRAMAREMSLPSANRADSQDLCFISGKDYHRFLRQTAPEVNKPGPIVNQRGEILGTHEGLAFYTIGQRKGLRIAAPEALYVIDKDLTTNRLIVGVKAELGKRELVAGGVNWLAGTPPTESVFKAKVKIRYRADYFDGTVQLIDEHRFRVEFDGQLRDITPGQAAVLYNGEECLGAGIIEI